MLEKNLKFPYHTPPWSRHHPWDNRLRKTIPNPQMTQRERMEYIRSIKTRIHNTLQDPTTLLTCAFTLPPTAVETAMTDAQVTAFMETLDPRFTQAVVFLSSIPLPIAVLPPYPTYAELDPRVTIATTIFPVELTDSPFPLQTIRLKHALTPSDVVAMDAHVCKDAVFEGARTDSGSWGGLEVLEDVFVV
ncbi:hypothetical protein P692DRAFT_201862496 [Suillus brevipes Sb2]|nr:hypothetical protein P692DRAFT_201862496 [Suillus brevipes Sb2]